RRKPLRREGSPSPCRQRASTPVVPLRASVSSDFPPPFEFGMPRLISNERGQGLNGRWLRLVGPSLPTITIEAADLPADVLALLDRHLLDLGGPRDPSAPDPTQ